MKIKITLIALFVCCLYSYSQQRPQRVRATPHPLTYIQPNGDTLTIRLHGDERGHFHTTLDGYRIEQDKKGFYRYQVMHKGETTMSNRKAHNQEKRNNCESRFLERKGIKH